MKKRSCYNRFKIIGFDGKRKDVWSMPLLIALCLALAALFLREESRERCAFAKELFRRWQERTGGDFVMDFVRKWKHLDQFGNPVS